MRYFNIFLLIIAFLFSGHRVSQAQVGLKKVAQSTMNFLLVNVSPRAGAMGETFIAVGKGAESIFFNPAGVVEVPGRFDMKMYATRWIADINYLADALVWNMGNVGSIGVSLLWVDYGTIHSTSLISKAQQAQYPLGYRDNGSMDNVGAYAIGVTYGRAISDRFMIGGNIRYVGHNLGQNMMGENISRDNNAVKLVFDAGVKYYTGLKSIRFGMAIRNFSSNLKREEISEPLPILFTMGVAMDLFQLMPSLQTDNSSLTFALDFLHLNNYTERLNIGAEYLLWNTIALRSGYQTNQDLASWSGGIGLFSGFGRYNITFDYSYSNFDIFQNVNRFSLGLSF
jgi:hypothetical protein